MEPVHDQKTKDFEQKAGIQFGSYMDTVTVSSTPLPYIIDTMSKYSQFTVARPGPNIPLNLPIIQELYS
jgi:hypothetical protein